MSDLIERSAVIDLIDKYTQDMSTDYWTANYGIPSGVFEDEIMDLPSAQPEQKWIPCSERLPETDEFVLASLSGRYKNIRFEHACEIADYADNEWFINAYPHMTAEIANDLIEAWMPLPEPYMKGVTTT